MEFFGEQRGFGWISHAVYCEPDSRLMLERMQATDCIFTLLLHFQNFDVLSADFEKTHVDGIVSKVVQNRDDLRLTRWFVCQLEQELRNCLRIRLRILRLNLLVAHLNINDNRISKFLNTV